MASPDEHTGQENMLPVPGQSSPRAFFPEAVRGWTDPTIATKVCSAGSPEQAPFARKSVLAWGSLSLVREPALPGSYAAEAANSDALTRDVA
jgi:hypothetical protein